MYNDLKKTLFRQDISFVMSQPICSFVSQHPDGNCKVIWDNKTVSSKQIKVYQSKSFFVCTLFPISV